MKAAGANSDTSNGDMKRRPSYPGELREKRANMSAKIWVKVAMAVAYFLSVSVAAFILAVYYAFFWTTNFRNGTNTNDTGGSGAPNRTECVPGLG